MSKVDLANIEANATVQTAQIQATSPTEMASIAAQLAAAVATAVQNTVARISEAKYQYMAILSNNATDLAIANQKYLLGLDQDKVKLAENETASKNADANLASSEAEQAKQSAKVAVKAMSEGYYDGNFTVNQDDGNISVTG